MHKLFVFNSKNMAKFSKENLIVNIDGVYYDAKLVESNIPADEFAAASVKYSYRLSNGSQIMYGWTKTEALDMFLQVADERGWAVFERLHNQIPIKP